MDYESIEVRKVKNGVVVALRTEDEDSEYVFDNNRKALRFVKDLLENKHQTEPVVEWVLFL